MSKRGLHNLYKREMQDGSTVWYFDGYVGKRRIRRSLDTGVLKQAKIRRDELLSTKADPKWSTSRLDTPIKTFWPLFLDHARRHKARNSVSSDVTIWKQFIDCLAPEKLGDVERDDVERFKRHLQDDRGQSGRSINDNLARVQSIYSHAIKLGYFAGPNPFEGFQRLPVDKAPVRYLTAEQRDAFMHEASQRSDDIHLFCAMCLYAGLRASEAAAAQWQWIDFKAGTLTVQGDGAGFRPKSKQFRVVPLHEKLRAILEPYKKKAGYILLPDKVEPGKWRIRYEGRRAFRSVARAAAVPWCTPHTLRHSFASALVGAGVSLYKVQTWLGHADGATTQRYAHLAPRDEDVNKF